MYKDWRGTPIEIGCHVVYPSRISSSLYVHEGVVEDICDLTEEELKHNYQARNNPEWAFKLKIRKLAEADQSFDSSTRSRIRNEEKGTFEDNPNYKPKYSVVSTVDVRRVTVVQ